MRNLDYILNRFIRKAQQEIAEVQPSEKGIIIVFEGLDGSGKSTQVKLLASIFEKIGKEVVVSKWNSANKISDIIRELKNKKDLKPQTWILLEAADLYERLRTCILPVVARGGIAILDRYYYTALVRGTVRGLNLGWIYNLYKYAPKPDFIFYFKVDPSVSMTRVIKRSKELTLSDVIDIDHSLKFYETGQDVSLAENALANFYMFQKEMLSLYDLIFNELKDKIYYIDASKDIFSIYGDILEYLREYKILQGFRKFKDIVYFVEFPKGSVRVAGDNKLVMPCEYGFIPNTLGEDLMEIDVIVGDNENSNKVIKFYHHNKKGKFSEVKYAIGFSSTQDAIEHYSKIYPNRILKYDELNWDMFKKEINENKLDPKTQFVENLIKINIGKGYENSNTENQTIS